MSESGFASLSFVKVAPIAIAVSFALPLAFAAGVSGNCSAEIIALSKGKGFDMQEFAKDLPPAVAKAKLQAKAPFGKPKDGDKTDIGMSFGCLKSFPENPAEIQSLLKEIGLETAKGVAANKFGTPEKKEISAGGSGQSLKECDAIFNPNKKFCYDGGIYDLCDGMSYNPTTHICSGDIANRALCNGAQYNPLRQKCENNIILAVCGKTIYDPKTHGCRDNVVLAKCGETLYDPQTQVCKDNVLLAKCGASTYSPKTHYCKDNAVLALSKCGEIFYDSQTHDCKNNVVLARCGEALYDPVMLVCKDNAVFARCGKALYDPKTHGCRDNAVLARCGKYLYDPQAHVCKDGEVLAGCGATEFYNPRTQECRFGSVLAK